MIRLASAFFRDSGGQIALMFAGMGGGLCVVAMLAITTNSMMGARASLQDMADQTALALAMEVNVVTQNDTQLSSVALGRVNALRAAKGDEPLEVGDVIAHGVRTAPLTVEEQRTGNAPSDTIEVVIETMLPAPPAAGLFGRDTIDVRVEARALRLGQSNLCVIALRDTDPNTLLMRDSARLTAPNCDIVSNSVDPEGLNVANAAKLQAKDIHSAGGASGQAINFTPAPITDSLSLADPLVNIPEPATWPCQAVPTIENNGSVTTLTPGAYCSGLVVNGLRDVFLKPGVYTFNGDLEVKENGILRGDGVTIHLADNGRFQARAGSTVRLTAAETGATAGILLFESRNNLDANVHVIETDDARYMVGTIYIPRGTFRVNTNAAVSDQSEYTAIVARVLQLHSASNLYLNTDYDATTVPTPPGVGPIDEGVRLVQ